MSDPRGVILDVDGTLVDSNDAHARAWVEALAAFGHGVPFERVRPLIGMGGDKLLPALTGLDKESDEGTRISARRRQIFMRRYLPHIRPFPAVADLLRRMRSDGLQLVVASSAEEGELSELLKITGVPELFERRMSSNDARHSKPAPDIVQAALAQSGLPPTEAVMLGDTPYDVEAAGKAGVIGIALRCGGWSDDDLTGAAAIYDDAAALLADWDASPLGRRAVQTSPATPSPARGGDERPAPDAPQAPGAGKGG